MNSSRGSSSRSKKKKGSSSKQNKPPSKDAESPFYTWHIMGGNPLEQGTKNYKKLKERYQELYDMSSKGSCAFYVSEYFSPEDHYHGAHYFRAPVPDKKLFPVISDSEVAGPSTKDGQKPKESKNTRHSS